MLIMMMMQGSLTSLLFILSIFCSATWVHAEQQSATSEAPYQQPTTESCETYCYSGGRRRCIPRSWFCDGINDCDYNFDENPIRCGATSEAPYQQPTTESCEVYCSLRGNYRCIPRSYMCDGYQDCDNNLDESPARCGATSQAPYQQPTTESCEVYCYWRGSYRCIPRSWICDRYQDCDNNLDESPERCGATTEATYQWPTTESCEIYCSSGGNYRCIPRSWICDGYQDCDSNLDESPARCGATTEVSYQWPTTDWNVAPDTTNSSCEVLCYSGGSRRCIPRNWLCDGIVDCDNNFDENPQRCGSTTEATYQWPTTDSGVTLERNNLRLAGVGLSYQGRLEVYHNGVWGTVCDDNFDNVDARVACRSLDSRFTSGYALGNQFGPGTGQIWLDDLNCDGSETELGSCRHRGWGSHNCGHNEDVSIACYR